MNILIAYDGSGYSHTSFEDLKYAGLPQKAKVLIVSVAEEWLSPKKNETTLGSPTDRDIIEYFQTRSEQIDRNLAETTAILVEAKRELQRNFPKWSVETEGHMGSPAQEILQRTVEFKPDLIVVGAQGLSSDGVSGIGSVSQKILSESHSQVRIVRGNPKTEPAHLKIVVCFDGSPCSIEAVKTVAQRSWRGQPEVRLLVVSDPLIALIPGRVFRVIQNLPEGKMKGEEKWIEFLTRKAVKILENAGLTASVHVYSGNPRTTLVTESDKWKSDTIFIGANSSQIPSHSLGCVASAVAMRATCTVETITAAQ